MQALKPIKTENEYKAALKALGAFFDNNPDNADQDTADYFEVLATLVETYEKEHYPIDPPNPTEAIKFRMEQSGLTVKDLTNIFGRTNRAYEVLNGKRPLSLAMIRKLKTELGISADILIG
ncbi:MAG: transcriptional regulator [Neisseriaceae bacterium]|nr:transcriptional regulator [Neisseriaceae bacterium]